jgi:hypothetical protein
VGWLGEVVLAAEEGGDIVLVKYGIASKLYGIYTTRDYAKTLSEELSRRF